MVCCDSSFRVECVVLMTRADKKYNDMKNKEFAETAVIFLLK